MRKLAVLLTIVVGLSGCGDNQLLTFEEQLAKDVIAIDAYLAENNILNVVEDPSGIRYVVNQEGTGLTPEISWIVKVKYKGNLLTDPDGFPFDQNTVGAEFILSKLIEGWQIILTQHKEGADLTLYIPSGYGYGFKGSPPNIPSNANLIFDITLMSARP
jgi:FKBP-type peptidyl-prolyl cis-trans isomerase